MYGSIESHASKNFVTLKILTFYHISNLKLWTLLVLSLYEETQT